jgi:hypothetical protein
MRELSAAPAAKTIKTLAKRQGHGAAPARTPQCLPNLLYKRILIPAASPRANVACSLGAVYSCFVLPTRSGPGKKTGRSPSQAGHDSAERCAKQKICWGRFGVHQQTRKCRSILRSSETKLEKFFWNTRLLYIAILFSDLSRRTHCLRDVVTSNLCKFQGALRKSDRRGS